MTKKELLRENEELRSRVAGKPVATTKSELLRENQELRGLLTEIRDEVEEALGEKDDEEGEETD